MDQPKLTISPSRPGYLASDMSGLLDEYIRRFSNLHRAALRGGGHAPHKPILLLTLLGEIESGDVTENRITLSGSLVVRFCSYWEALVSSAKPSRGIIYPFRYLIHEGFWELVRDGQPLMPADLGHPTSIGQLTSVIAYGRFASDLWFLLQTHTARVRLRDCLLTTYFGAVESPAVALPASPMAYQIERLKAEAQARFRSRWVSEHREDKYFVRHTLFPAVIRSLYDDVCAVCRVHATADSASVVEAAHILPFSEFHNDDPRNGLALCKNHHWAFDAGAISIGSDYTVQVSRKLAAADGFATRDAKLMLPADANCFPAVEALAWHRENRWLDR